MQLLIISNCSARKTADPVRSLCARTLPRGTPRELAAEWRLRCSAADMRVTASRLYAGRGFSLACEVAGSTGAQLRIVSAGMGLLQPDTLIPSYSLTVSPTAADCILARAAPGASFSADQWWGAIRAHPAGFARLLANHPRALLLIATTRPYLRMVAGELASLTDSARDRIRIIGLTRARVVPEALRPYVMPYDSRLDDAERKLRGTSFDFPVRALAHFAELVKSDRRMESPEKHAARVRQSLAHWRAPHRVIRKPIHDVTLKRKIKQFKRQSTSRTAALRRLRVELGLACEQQRFAIAWDRM